MSTKIVYDNPRDHSIEIHRSHDGEWAGLYIDGKLDTYGDSYLADERLQVLCGVEYVENSPWLADGHRTPFQTTDEIKAARVERDDKLERAEALRAEAAKLQAEADVLVGKR